MVDAPASAAGLELGRDRSLVADLLAQLRRILLREQPLDRVLHEAWIAEIAVPVGERAPHRFGLAVHQGRGAERGQRDRSPP